MDVDIGVHKYFIRIVAFHVHYIKGKPFGMLGTKSVNTDFFCEQNISLSNEFLLLMVLVNCNRLYGFG